MMNPYAINSSASNNIHQNAPSSSLLGVTLSIPQSHFCTFTLSNNKLMLFYSQFAVGRACEIIF